MTNVWLAIKNLLSPASSKERVHEYGLVEEGSECNILESCRQGTLIIAPFRDRNYNHTVLVVNPRSLCILTKFSGSKLWRLWDNYFAVIIEGLPTIRNVAIFTISSKKFRKVKNVSLPSHFSTSLIRHILSCKLYKAIYIIEDFKLCMANIVSNVRQEWTSQDKILQGFICREMKALIICSSNKIFVYSLDSLGRVKTVLYRIPFELEFGIACLENRELTLITYERRAHEIVYAESDEENDLNIYLSRFRLDIKDFETCQKDFLLAEVPDTEYKFEFVSGNKALACISDQKPVIILSVSTGELLFKHSIIGNILKIHPKEEAIFISNESSLLRLNLENYIPS